MISRYIRLKQYKQVSHPDKQVIELRRCIVDCIAGSLDYKQKN